MEMKVIVHYGIETDTGEFFEVHENKPNQEQAHVVIAADGSLVVNTSHIGTHASTATSLQQVAEHAATAMKQATQD
jgi:hypothetical protein